MNNITRGRIVRCIIVLLLLGSTIAAWAFTTPTPGERKSQLGRMVDARVNLKDAFQRATAARAGVANAGRALSASMAPAIANAIAARSVTQPGLEVRLSNLSGGPASIRDKTGALTGPAPGLSSEAIVRGYLQQNGDMFGLSAADLTDLVVLGDSAGGTSSLRMLRMEQQINGRPVFQSETRFVLDRDGRLVKAVGLIIPNARAFAAAASAATYMTPEAAVSKLLAAEGRTVDPATYTVVSESGGRFELSGGDGYIAGPITARQVLFPLAPGLLVPAWSLVAFTTGEQDWYAVVDAETGDLLWRKGIRDYASAHDARFRVYVQADGTTPADSPAPQSPNTVAPGSGTQFTEIAPTIVSMHAAMLAVDPSGTASPNGWIDDCPGGVCTANQTQTLGNNVLACLDRTVGVSPTFVGSNVCDTDAGGVLDGNGRPTGNPDINARNRDFLGTAPRDFETGFLPPPQAGNPEAGQTATGAGTSGTAPVDQFRRGSITHLFYLSNWYHDKLFKLGFDEASGNFQQTNFSGFGLGNDRVLADAQDGRGTNNANFSTPPDGTSGRMQMYVFTGPTIDRDGSLDAEIVLHELTHGTSNRLIGNGAGLNWDPAAGLGEGWSDFYALSLLNNTNADDPNGRYAAGAYATYKAFGVVSYTDNYVYGIRRFPYSINHSVNPMTWADVDDVTNNLSGGIAADPLGFNFNGGMEVHNIGEIWALTLWGVRARVIANPAGANGDVPTGNHTMLQLVTDGLKMTPIDPSFTDARDAIIQADCATNGCANEGSIWAGFADRGLGYGAKTPYNVSFGFTASHMAVHESFSVPFLDVVNVATDVTINDSAPNNNNGVIDLGEAIKLTVKLTNPWRAASKAVTGAVAALTTSTAGITIYDNTSTYGAIAPQGTVAGDTFMFTVSPSLTAGAPIDFTLTTVSNLGTTATTFQLRVGAASGTDPVLTYTGTPSPALAIPDAAPRGVFHQITVTDDFVIADLNFRIDSITHTFTGDLTAMLRSPGGVGVDLVSLIGGITDGGPGANITNMVIDDDVPRTAANDMVQAFASAAPFTKSWSPVFNSPWGPLMAGFPATDPIGNLSRYDGTSTKGTWTIHVSDQFLIDSGTLNAWSILVTPVHFASTAFVPTVNVTATKTVAGTFRVGQTVTYTVTLTNNGTANQADNAGHEFTDVLPSSLTLVNALATSGTAVATVGTNTVTWDGSLAPLGGSVTITITATINAGTPGGTVVSNQGTISFDADANGSNETSRLTDDPAVGGASDPTLFTVTGTNANLNNLTISAGTLSPAFAGSTTSYTDSVPNATSSVTVTPTVADATATIKVNGSTVASGSASGAIALAVGSGNVINVVITAQDGTTTKTYTITVTRAPGAASTNADLSNLTISAGSLVPAFASGTLAYTDAVSNATSSVTVTPTVADATATIKVNGSTVASGSASGVIALAVGSGNVINVVITAQDGTTTKTYTITVTRAAPGLVPARFIPVTPCRMVDTRSPGVYPISGGGMASGESRSFALPSSACGIPSNALAYSLNATVVPTGPLGYLTMWPTGQTQPLVSTLNSFDGRTKANAAIVPAGTAGAVSAFVTDSTDLILDIDGYFVAAGSGGDLAFYPLSPCRLSDTRFPPGTNGGPTMGAGETRTLSTWNLCGIPSGAPALSLNYTVVPQGPLGFLTTWPTGQGQPLVSTLNAPTGTVVANAAIIPTGTGGQINVFVTNTTDVIVDVDGYFAPAGSPGALSFFAATPCRVSDTRNPVGPFGGPQMAGGSTRSYAVPGSACGIPSSAQAYSLNATVVPSGLLGYLTLWPTGISQPLVSTLNAWDGAVSSNAALVPAGTAGGINAFVTNSTDLILDINGYFAP